MRGRMTLIVGLTGGIGSGKSTVARMLAKLGAEVIDADAIARELVRPGTPILAAIGRRFGPQFIDDSGALRRKELGALVFADRAALSALNEMTHPAIMSTIEARVTVARLAEAPVVAIDAALLIELNVHKRCDQLIVVRADASVRVSRIVARDGLPAERARARIAAQISDEARLALADHVIDNDGDLTELERSVVDVWRRLGGRDGRIRN